MKYPYLKTEKTVRCTVEALRGGCNLRDSDHRLSDTHLTTAENVWWNEGALRTRPGFHRTSEGVTHDSNVTVSWKFCAEDTVSNTHIGRRFLRREVLWNEKTATFKTGLVTYDGSIVFEGSMGGFPKDTEGMVMEYPYSEAEDVLIFLSNGAVYAQRSDTYAWRNVSAEVYIPTLVNEGAGIRTSLNTVEPSKPNFESLNLLSDYYYAKYSTTPEDLYYYLPHGFDSAYAVEARLTFPNGAVWKYTVAAGASESAQSEAVKLVINRTIGRVYFKKSDGNPYPMPEGLKNNLVILAPKPRDDLEKKRIARMSFSTWFGGTRAGCDSRQFLSGSTEKPNRMYWSAQGQPLYFPVNNYIAVGNAKQAITAFGKQDGRLFIFKERELYSLTDSVQTVSVDTVDGQVGTEYFPITQIHGQIGCMAPQTVRVCGNRLCWADGVGEVHTLLDSTNGYTVHELSALIAPALKGHGANAFKKAVAAVLDGHYLLAVGQTIYALRIDEKAFKRYESVYDDAAAQQQLAWFVWKLPSAYDMTFLCGNGQAAVAMIALENGFLEQPLCIEGTTDAVYDGSDWSTAEISACVRTAAYDFGDPVNTKRVLRMRLETEGETAAATVLFYGDGETKDAQAFSLETGEIVLTPHCPRVKRFGFELQLRGQVAVSSAVITVRRSNA